MRPLYFDYNATTPILPRVFEAMRPYLTERFGNPSSAHSWGLEAKQGMERAREQVAELLNAPASSVSFTGGATESNHIAIVSPFMESPKGRLLVSAVEHPAVLGPARWLAQRGVDVVLLPVNAEGVVELERVEKACKAPVDGVKLLSLMRANNETGVLQPVAEAAAIARASGYLVHTDAAQAVGKIPVDAEALGVDLLTVAGHKLYAPKGVGALYVRPGLALAPLAWGGGQERGLRPGTENIPYMAGLGAACALAKEDLPEERARQERLGRLLDKGLQGLGWDYLVFGEGAPRLPNTRMLGFKGLAAGDVLSGLVGLDVGVSAGAACHAEGTSLSHTLEAMAADPVYASSALRISWGRPTSEEDVAGLLDRLSAVLRALRA
jgi:cysteine desulfurase